MNFNEYYQNLNINNTQNRNISKGLKVKFLY